MLSDYAPLVIYTVIVIGFVVSALTLSFVLGPSKPYRRKLLPYESGIATPVGRFQFVLGREIGISFYGNYSFIIPTAGLPPNNATVLALSSIQYEFPIVEYRPFRSFSLDQSSSVLIQLYYAIDMPSGNGSVQSPVGAPAPSLQNIHMLGLRAVFDWRHYFR